MSNAATADDWTRVSERGNAPALRAMGWIARHAGRRVTRLLLGPIALYFLLCAPAARRNAGAFLERALGERPTFVQRLRHFHRFAATVLDRVYLLDGRLDLFDFTVQGRALIETALAQGRGAFVIGAHVGSFEVLRAVGNAAMPALRVAMVMYPDNARRINAALQALAPGRAPHVIALGRVESMLEVRDWLDGNGLAGMLADRTLPVAPARSTTLVLPFLGTHAPFSDGPFRLAALLRRRVVFMVGLYLGGDRYDVRFEPLADFSNDGAMDDAADGTAQRERRIEAAVRTFAARLEALAREQPFNWFNFHDFFVAAGVPQSPTV